MAKTNNVKSKLKKATLMAGIAAAATIPLKSSAQNQVQDKNTNKVEISVNPDQVRENIRVLQVDSANVANYMDYAIKIVDHINKIHRSNDRLNGTLENLTKKDSVAFSDKLIEVIKAALELQQSIVDEQEVVKEYILSGVQVATESRDIDKIKEKLIEQRMLLKLAENGK